MRSYIDLINAFWNWKQLNDLSTKATTLYFAILHCANRAGWQEDVRIPNSALMILTEMCISDLQKKRNELVQKGLIVYDKGKRGQSGVYTLQKIVFHMEYNIEHNPEHNVEHNVEYNVEHNPEHIYRYKTKTKNKTETITPPLPPSEDVKRVSLAWQKASAAMMTEAQKEELLDMLERYGVDKVEYAIQQAVRNDAVKLAYVRAVLEERNKNKLAGRPRGAVLGQRERERAEDKSEYAEIYANMMRG